MIANHNTVSCDGCNNYNLTYLQNLQNQVDRTISAKINRKRASEANDLGIRFNQENYWELGVYNRILSQIKYCNSCFDGYDFDEINSLVKNTING